MVDDGQLDGDGAMTENTKTSVQWEIACTTSSPIVRVKCGARGRVPDDSPADAAARLRSWADNSLPPRGSGLATRTRHDRGVGAVGRAGQVLFAHPGSACTPGTIVASQVGNSTKPEVAHVRLQ